ncbi:MAG: sigma-54-dependent Fis family transcriptional regulator [Planctomycetaceae bacterium]|nr:sigma-54-dependent Fis family transcriptional regulator [Planctomycetaceae bacterium]
MSPTDDEQVDLNSIPIRVLIVDDDEAHAQTVAEILERVGAECTVCTSGRHAVSIIEGENFDVVITDMKMDEIDGLDILRKTKEELPDAEVIVVTGHGSINSAVTAMQHGAYTYLPKPLDVKELRNAVAKASTRLRLIRRNAELSRSLDERFGFEGVVGSSQQMQKVIEALKHVAPTDSTVLITGENGTGKELVARALHQNSPRKSKPFVPLNISAIPESILESELFGHEQGAFTGAVARRLGKFEYANGGTLFLDEVGEMPVDTQIKLLRVLEDRKITRLGANEEVVVNVRLVAATNADLKTMVEDGRFRRDLYYRLNIISISLPPLRERRSDIPLLMDHFRRELSERSGKETIGFSRAARQAILAYDWPGNIRQLRNTVERMVVMDTDGSLDVDDLPEEIAELVADEGDESSPPVVGGADTLIGRPLSVVERYYIERALELCHGKREEAARLLGIGERTLYRKIKDYELRD